MPPLPPPAEEVSLITSLHGACLRRLASYLQRDVDGLTVAARHARKQGAITNSTFKRLEKVDAAFAVIRHATVPKFDAFFLELDAQIRAAVAPTPPEAAPPPDVEPSLPAGPASSSPPGDAPPGPAGNPPPGLPLPPDHEPHAGPDTPPEHSDAPSGPALKRSTFQDRPDLAAMVDSAAEKVRQQFAPQYDDVNMAQAVLNDLQERRRRMHRDQRRSPEGIQLQQECHKMTDQINEKAALLDTLYAEFEDLLRAALPSGVPQEVQQECVDSFRSHLDRHKPNKNKRTLEKNPGFGKGPRRTAGKR